MPEVEVGLGPIVGDEDLPVLRRVHGSRIDVQVRVQLLDRDLEPARLKQRADRRRCQAFAQRRDDAARDKDELGPLGRGFASGGHQDRPPSGNLPPVDCRCGPRVSGDESFLNSGGHSWSSPPVKSMAIVAMEKKHCCRVSAHRRPPGTAMRSAGGSRPNQCSGSWSRKRSVPRSRSLARGAAPLRCAGCCGFRLQC